MLITDARAIKIMNSRNEPTISLVLETKAGKVQASAPSGKSRGKYEAEQYSYKGIDFSITFANAVCRRLISQKISFNSFEDLEKLEKILLEYDKTKNWHMIGGNVVFVIESAILKAMALAEGKELWKFLNDRAKNIPMPVGNCIGGGQHIRKEKKSDIQEFLLIPETKNFFDSYFVNLQAYKEIKKILYEKDSVWRNELTDEKAMASSLRAENILELLNNVSSDIKKKLGINLRIGMDVAASSLWNNKAYSYANPKISRSKEEQLEFMSNLIKKFNIFYIEDAFQEDDFESFAKLPKSSKCLIVGDDLTATQPDRLKMAIENNSINAVIVKPNQNGSLLETKKFVDLAHKNKIITIISHRSGETSDSTISDLAVAWNIPFIKVGILGKERFAKLNKLLKIEREIGRK